MWNSYDVDDCKTEKDKYKLIREKLSGISKIMKRKKNGKVNVSVGERIHSLFDKFCNRRPKHWEISKDFTLRSNEVIFEFEGNTSYSLFNNME